MNTPEAKRAAEMMSQTAIQSIAEFCKMQAGELTEKARAANRAQGIAAAKEYMSDASVYSQAAFYLSQIAKA